MYRMLRVFCASSWELERERRAFYDVVGQINEIAMADGLLYVPVSLTNIRDKRPYQCLVEENLAECSHYILALTEAWGPAERNFERDYQLALEELARPSSPMRNVKLLVREPSSCTDDLATAGYAPIRFATIEDFQRIVRELLADSLTGDRLEMRAASVTS